MHNRQRTFFIRCYQHVLTVAIVMILAVVAASAQRVDTLPGVNVRALKIKEAPLSVPYQTLSKESISKLNSVSVADAIKFFSGVIIKDYGGIGGLKTISVRSLGANSTAIMYDGILLTDAQSGQIDLGKISIDNIDNIALYSAQPDELLLPARSFSAASIVVLKSTLPVFNSRKAVSGRMSVRTGSFGFISPAIFIQYQPGKHFYQKLSTEFQHANGKYTFNSYETGSGKTTRKNAGVDALRLEYDAGFLHRDSSTVKFKSYYYNSARGLPGAIVLYNSQTREKLFDENFFVQSSWRKNLSAVSSLLLNVKYSINKNKYVDPDFPNSQGGIRNNFRQDEYYLSGVYGWKNSKTFSWSYGSDFFKTTLKRNDDFSQGFANPTRSSWLNNLGARLKMNKAEFGGNLLYSRMEDKVKSGTSSQDINALTPTITLAFFPFKSVPLSIRAFYKSIFRMPTFNDLYYTYIGNTSLRPEYAKQYNAGLTYTATGRSLIQTIVVSSDCYINNVTDKILAVPRQNLFQWTMLNIGKVTVKGIDAAIHLYSKELHHGSITTHFSYSYQQALDKSLGSASYNNQLPYTPKHSGSITAQYTHERMSLSYNAILSGYRYRIGEQTSENLVKEWATQDINVSYKFFSKSNLKYKLTAEANNIFDKQYEVIRYYPMPGFNFRVGLTVQF